MKINKEFKIYLILIKNLEIQPNQIFTNFGKISNNMTIKFILNIIKQYFKLKSLKKIMQQKNKIKKLIKII